MSRYYDIQIFKPGSKDIFREYTSFPNGVNDPGALNVVLDIYEYAAGTPTGQAMVQIWGVSIDDIAQANNFTNCTIMVFAGFQAGFPLNNVAQAGLILSGTIWQSFGNWQGVNMTLDFVVVTGGSIAAQTTNIPFVWKTGTTLASALATTFNTAFPNIKQNIQINPNLVLAHDETGIYQSLAPMAQSLKALSAAAIGGTYPGIDIVWSPTQINVFDGSTQTTPTQIAFQDLIGQPVWIGPNTLQCIFPMRADLSVGSYITMPKGILGNPANPAGAPGAVVTTTASQPQARQQTIFSGNFQVILVHHMGIFRQPDGAAWVTVINANLQQPLIPIGNVNVDQLDFAPSSPFKGSVALA